MTREEAAAHLRKMADFLEKSDMSVDDMGTIHLCGQSVGVFLGTYNDKDRSWFEGEMPCDGAAKDYFDSGEYKKYNREELFCGIDESVE